MCIEIERNVLLLLLILPAHFCCCCCSLDVVVFDRPSFISADADECVYKHTKEERAHQRHRLINIQHIVISGKKGTPFFPTHLVTFLFCVRGWQCFCFGLVWFGFLFLCLYVCVCCSMDSFHLLCFILFCFLFPCSVVVESMDWITFGFFSTHSGSFWLIRH